MKKPGFNNLSHKLHEIFSVVLMCACLLLLTGSNFVIYPQQNISSTEQRDRESKAPPTPTEEKSGETKPLTSIQEEYLHEHGCLELKWINHVVLHKIHQAEKLPFAPNRKVYCPPKFS